MVTDQEIVLAVRLALSQVQEGRASLDSAGSAVMRYLDQADRLPNPPAQRTGD